MEDQDQQSIPETSGATTEEFDPKRSHFRRLLPLMILLFLLTCAGPASVWAYKWIKGDFQKPYSEQRSESEQRIAEQVAKEMMEEAKQHAAKGERDLALSKYRSIYLKYSSTSSAALAREEFKKLEKNRN